MVTAVKCQVEAYARSVVSGETIACKWVRLACERHLRDLEKGHERGLWFDAERAEWCIDFFRYLPHIKGEWARDPQSGIELEPWQAFIVGSVFGWQRADGTRRFRTMYAEIPRKNGKSALCSGIGLLLAFFDDEPGAEVYSAATKRDQAKIVWGDAAEMVRRRAELRRRIRVFVGALSSPETASKFAPLSSDANTLDGLNVHGAVVDELHAHKSREIVDVLETATGARRQPLLCYITTAGHDRHSVCWSHHEYSEKVLDRLVDDDSWFTYIATIDAGDDWRSPDAWAKANPNYGVSVSPDDLQRKCERAQAMPSEQNAFRRLHLNVWTESATRWIDAEQWDKGNDRPIDLDDLAGRECYAGLDLSSTQDLTALALMFPNDDGSYDVLPYFWVPEEGMRKRADKDRVPYALWAEQGYLEATEGAVVDYDVIRARINELGRVVNIREIAIDRWNSTHLQTQLDGDGFTVVPFGQGFGSMAAPTKEFERLVVAGAVHHGGHPVLSWCVSNVVVETDAAENKKPNKKKSTERIDGAVACVMALGRAMVQQEAGDAYSDGVAFV